MSQKTKEEIGLDDRSRKLNPEHREGQKARENHEKQLKENEKQENEKKTKTNE